MYYLGIRYADDTPSISNNQPYDYYYWLDEEHHHMAGRGGGGGGVQTIVYVNLIPN